MNPHPVTLKSIQRKIEKQRCREDIDGMIYAHLSDASEAMEGAINRAEALDDD